jgi:heme oxygenase
MLLQNKKFLSIMIQNDEFRKQVVEKKNNYFYGNEFSEQIRNHSSKKLLKKQIDKSVMDNFLKTFIDMSAEKGINIHESESETKPMVGGGLDVSSIANKVGNFAKQRRRSQTRL